MTKHEKIQELEAEFDRLVEQEKSNLYDRLHVMIAKEIIRAKITALNWKFDGEK